MPMSSPKRRISDTENKLRILLSLDLIGPVSQDDLWPFFANLELMDYITYCILVDELRSDGAIATGSHALEGMLYLTASGKQQVSLFGERLLQSDRERIVGSAASYRNELSGRKQVRAVYELSAGEHQNVALTLREGDVPTLFLRVSSTNGELLRKIIQAFHHCAPQVLNLLYTLDFAPNTQPMPPVCGQDQAVNTVTEEMPAVCTFGGREHAAVVKLTDQAGFVTYTVLLLLPSARIAWDWACCAKHNRAMLAKSMTTLFENSAHEDKSHENAL